MSPPLATTSRTPTVVIDSSDSDSEMDSSRSSPQASEAELSGLAEVDAKAEGADGAEMKQDTVAFEPHKMLMETTLTIEYGKDLTGVLTIHEEMLCCHSRKFEQLRATAKPLREKYAKSKTMRDEVARFVFPEMNARTFEQYSMEKKAIPLILCICEDYPHLDHLSSIKKNVDDAIKEQITRKNTKAPPSGTGNGRKRDQQDTSSSLTLKERLFLLNSRGVQTVMDALFARLHKVYKSETMKATGKVEIALAQRRVIVPDTKGVTVHSFIQWLYRGTIHCEDAHHLYSLLHLSDQLGTQALSETCLAKLHNAACGSIQNALEQGISLFSLLQNSTNSNDGVIDVIFTHVFEDKNPPKRLLQLVVDALADNLDMTLWGQVKDLVSHDLALRLIEAMIARQQARVENSDCASIKSESELVATDQQLSVTTTATQ